MREQKERGKYLRGVETLVEILKKVAFNKEIHQYRLAPKLGLSYKTVMRGIHELRDVEWITVRTETSEKHGKDRNIWKITLKGMIELLTFDVDAWEQLDLIAETHKDKLLIFKKWKFFKEEGLNETVKASFMITLQSIVRKQLSLLSYYQTMIEWTPEELRKLLDSMTLGCYALRFDPLKTLEENKDLTGYLKILTSCKKDQELYHFVLSELQFFQKIAVARLSYVREGLTFLQKES